MQKEFLENVEELLEKDRGKLEMEANSNTNISVSLEDVSNEEVKTNNSDDVESLKIIDEESFVKKSDSNSGNMKIFDYVEDYFNNSDDIKESYVATEGGVIFGLASRDTFPTNLLIRRII